MFKSVLVAAATAVLTASTAQATPAFGPPDETTYRIRISYADLDITTHAGARVLMDRIARAAAIVCGGGPDSLMHDDRVRFERCRTEAYGRAVGQLDPKIILSVSDYPPQPTLFAAR